MTVAVTVANDVQVLCITSRLILIEPGPVYWQAAEQHFLACIVARPLGACQVEVETNVLKAMESAAFYGWRSCRRSTTLAFAAGSDLVAI